jgi:hypothetical protein
VITQTHTYTHTSVKKKKKKAFHTAHKPTPVHLGPLHVKRKMEKVRQGEHAQRNGRDGRRGGQQVLRQQIPLHAWSGDQRVVKKGRGGKGNNSDDGFKPRAHRKKRCFLHKWKISVKKKTRLCLLRRSFRLVAE